MTVWDTLGVDPDSDRDTLRRAYARKLKQTHPEDDPEGFKTLREAYEMALQWVDDAARWRDDEESEPDAAEAPAPWLADDAPPAPTFRVEALAEPEPETQPREITALLAARDSDRAALHAAMRALDQALRGTWRASDEELEALFNDILAAPAMTEIATRDDVETWSAELIAATIPRSDAILLQAVQRFGWTAEPHRQTGLAVAACLERIDEWRIIQELGHHRHRFNGAWRSLTRPAGAWWSWRIDAFRPGLETGVATLLGLRGPVAPGLHFSFKTDSVERWKRLLARPHATLTMLAAAAVAALLAFIVGTSLNPDRSAATPDAAGLWLTLAAAIAAPVLLYALHVLRFANERGELSGWRRDGWMLGFVALAALAPALPVSAWSVAGFGAAALAIWGWMTATSAPTPVRDVLGRLASLWLPLAASIFAGLIALVTFPVSPALILCGMTVLYLLVRLGGWDDGVAGLRRSVARGPALALATIAALVVPSACIVLATFGKVPGYVWFDGAACALLGAAPVLSAAYDTDRRWVARGVIVVRIGLVALLGTGWFLALDSLPGSKATVTTPTAQGDGSRPTASTDPGTLRGDIVAALAGGATDAALAKLADSQPGFGQIERGNPALWDRLRATLDAGAAALRRREQAANAVVALLAQAYRTRLPRTTTGLVREEFAIRLERLKALQAVAPAACIAPRTQFDELALDDNRRHRQTSQALNVASNETVGEATATVEPLSVAAWDRRAAEIANEDVAGYRRELAGRAGPERQCAAMIARLQALVGGGYKADPAAVATMRAMLLRESIAAPRPLE